MQNEIRLLSSVINDKNIAPLLNASNIDQLFVNYPDVWDTMRQYYYEHREIIPQQIIEDAFAHEPIPFKVVETQGAVKHYLNQLRDEYTDTLLDRLARGISKDLGNKSRESIINGLFKITSEINNASGNIKDLDITDKEKAAEHYREVKRIMDENGGVLGIKFGFDSIDANYVTGLAPGQYIWIMSRTNQGKSWVALDIAINAWAQGKKVVYVSLEMSPSSVRDRAYTLMSEGKFSMSDLCRAEIDFEALESWTDEFMSSKSSFIVTSSDGMGDFKPAHLQAKFDQYGPDLIVIDYAQLMSDNKGSQNPTDKMRSLSKELKAFSMSNEVPVLTVVSASSNDAKDYNTPPEIHEAAESKQAAYDADLVLSLISKRMPGKDDMVLEVAAKKNRHGPLFGFNLKLNVNTGTLEEVFDVDDTFE